MIVQTEEGLSSKGLHPEILDETSLNNNSFFIDSNFAPIDYDHGLIWADQI